ncbi:MAG: hypothetical protein LBI57_03425 [Helicobacteraceae bacterium]|jgi:hypothetical protein|nr:hypothetical protein [Helicobacteraceae bacterium]
MDEKNYYLAGGRLYFTLEEQAEREIGDIIDATIAVETETAECLSRSNGAAEVVAESVRKRDYTLTFTTTNLSTANLSAYFYGSTAADKTYAPGEIYRNGKTLALFDEEEAYDEGDTVIENGAIYEAPGSIAAGTFDADEWKRLGSASVKVTRANANNKIIGSLRIEGEPTDGKKISFIVYRISLAPSGAFSLMGDEYAQLVFSGKIQRTDRGVFDLITEA